MLHAIALTLVGLLAAATAAATPLAPANAQFSAPTNRYPHNVLGNIPGFGALDVTLADGTVLRRVLPEHRVFEDVAPRLWDVDDDGISEIVVVESDARLGARLTAWNAVRGMDGTLTLDLRAAGDFIGTRFRWLAPVGMADFTRDGQPDIVYVAMPHLAKQLVLVELRGNRFDPVARLDGVSNHRIGQEFITGRVFLCPSGPVAQVPSGDWGTVLHITFAGNRLAARKAGRLQDLEQFTKTPDCN